MIKKENLIELACNEKRACSYLKNNKNTICSKVYSDCYQCIGRSVTIDCSFFSGSIQQVLKLTIQHVILKLVHYLASVALDVKDVCVCVRACVQVATVTKIVCLCLMFYKFHVTKGMKFD